MRNLDMEQRNSDALRERIKLAIDKNDADGQAAALLELAESISGKILNEYRGMTADMLNDRTVLASRGVYDLTGAERKYYNAVIEGGGFGGTEELLPPSIINRVFEHLTRQHELLGLIDFRNVTATTEWLMRKGEVPGAWWGKLTGPLREVITDGFETMQMTLFKLTAFIPVHKSMLAVGPEWLDKYVREVLAESMALALEDAIINGDGKDRPIGMMRDVTDGNHPEKEPEPLADLSPETLGGAIMAPLTKDGKRAVKDVVLLVNPTDYWTKIFPATAFLTPGGTYAYGVLPIPAKIINCVSVPKGKMVAGIATDYFMGVGASQKMEVSDEALFIEDQRVYAQKLIANGRPIDNDSFLVFDISELNVLQSDMRSVFIKEV